jgi:hypothetical protein
MARSIEAIPVDLSQAVPPNAKRVRLRYRTVPASGVLLLYASPGSDPVAVSGEGEIEIAIIGPKIYVQKSRGMKASSFLDVVGFAI